MPSGKWRSSCLGLNVLDYICGQLYPTLTSSLATKENAWVHTPTLNIETSWAEKATTKYSAMLLVNIK